MNPLAYIKNVKKLHALLNSRVKLTWGEMNKIVKRLEFKNAKKGEVLTQIGEVEQYLYFVVQGMMRLYFYRDEKEISLDFFFAEDFTGSLSSFLTRQPSTLSLEALAPVSLVRIKYDDLQSLYTEGVKFERMVRLFTEELFMKISDKNIELLSLSATERYEKLLHAQPKYVQEIPLKYLASYLNITPESLSRIRKNL
jgi:CRP/FNR family transcriptional regulator, anaerobic regulatory protein